jgi:TolB-like protein/DNA-binding winged helix-turn-helix (wHTH) protein/tetratricopeptide (TPR) repeat protein
MLGRAAKTYRFGEFTLDLSRGRLEGARGPIELRPKSFEVLRYFVEHPDRLISKDELLDAVWANVHVTEDSLTRCISEIRAALADADQKIIQNLPRRGYILATPVSETDRADGVQPIPVAEQVGRVGSGARSAWLPSLTRANVLAAGTLVALLIALAVWFSVPAHRATTATERASIAVLPFVNLGGDPGQDYLGEGISAEIIANLSKFAQLLVVAEGSSSRYTSSTTDSGRIGREINVRYLVRGSVQRDGSRLRIIAQLLEAATGGQIWAQQYDRELAGVFTVQDDVTQNIVGTLFAHVSRNELDRVMRKPAGSFAAYEYFLQGRSLLNKIYANDRGLTLATARGLFEKSLELDPGYAPALQGIAAADVLIWLEPTNHPQTSREYNNKEILDRALDRAQRAVELDRTLPEAYGTLAWVLHWHYRRDESLAAFERAYELNPSLADCRYSLILTHRGRPDEGIAVMKRTMRLDPFHAPVCFTWLGNAYYLAGRYDEAFQNLSTAANRMPVHRPTRVWLAAAAAQSGQHEVAKSAVAAVLKQQPNLTITKWLDLLRLPRSTDAGRLADGMRKAGFPE